MSFEGFLLTLGNSLRKLRRQRDMTQVQIASLLGIKQSVVSDIERGKCEYLSLVTLCKIAKIYNRKMLVIFRRKETI